MRHRWITKKSVFSFLYQLTMQCDSVRRCCWALAVQQLIDIPCPAGPQQQSHCTQPQQSTDGTDRWTDAHRIVTQTLMHTTWAVSIVMLHIIRYYSDTSFESDNIRRTQKHALLSRTTWVSWYQKGKTNLDFTEAKNSEWQWQQLGHIQVCT